jgi:hypothetical protein
MQGVFMEKVKSHDSHPMQRRWHAGPSYFLESVFVGIEAIPQKHRYCFSEGGSGELESWHVVF